MFFWLINQDVSVPNGVYHLRLGCLTLGRSVKCDIHVEDPSISRVHAIVVQDQESVVVRDMASFNGTFVNGVRVRESPLVPGDNLRIGRISFDLVEGSEAPAGLDDDNATPPLSQLRTDSHGRLERLTPGQRRVLRLLLAGLSEKQIAARLDLSRHTVHNHVKEIYRVVGVQSRAELMAILLAP
jgi:DNA-binding CsgD family transcriptional regulator